jgi:polysaccharide export outer membrane protein
MVIDFKMFGLIRTLCNAGVVVLTLWAASAAAGYLLQPGDVVRVSVVGMAELSGVAPIDNDGVLRLPQFTPVESAGRTLEEVQDDLRLATAGRLVRRFDDAGAPIMLSVAGGEIHLTIEQRRPVTLTGAVTRPGTVPFRPGLTVRAAVAEAGGVSRLSNATNAGFAGAPDALAQVRALTQERALRMAERWRHGVLLGEASIEAPPDAAALGVSTTAAATLIAAQRRLLELTEEQRASEEAFLSAAQAQIAERKAILERQAEAQRDAVAADEEELSRVVRLLERGVVPQDRLLDVRRSQVLSATRLLSTQNEQERVTLDGIRFAEQAGRRDADHAAEAIAEIVTLNARLSEVEARLTAAQERLAMAGVDPGALMMGVEAEPSAVVYRGAGASAAAEPIRFDDLVEAGDVIEILFEEERP